MPIPAAPDMSGLARLAQSPDPGLRPLLLRLEAASFASAPGRPRDAVQRFESLALGLIPLVTSDVLAEVASLLRGAPDTPASVRALLSERLALTAGAATGDESCERAERPDLPAAEVAGLLALARDDVDLALAGNGRLAIDGRCWQALVARARSRARLARRLLARPEATACDRAALYGQADAAGRDLVRGEMSAAWAVDRPGRALPHGSRQAVLALATSGDVPGLLRLLRSGLAARDPLAFDLRQDGGRELLILALVALGLEPDDCVRVSLTLDAATARSIPTVFRLADVARTTPRAVAARILARAAPSGSRPESMDPGSPTDGRPSDRLRRGVERSWTDRAARQDEGYPRPARSRLRPTVRTGDASRPA